MESEAARTKKFKKVNLVSSIPGLARHLDPKLINGWGIVVRDGKLYVSAADGHSIQVYDKKGVLLRSINIPFGEEGGSPTGLVFNPGKGFVISNGINTASSELIVVTEEGGIYGYSPLVDVDNAILKIDDSGEGAKYKGIAVKSNLIYVANFTGMEVNVYDYNWNELVSFPFVDPTLPLSYSPFNVSIIKDKVYVAYAVLGGGGDEVKGPGFGIVSVFNLEGIFLRRLISNGGKLNAPWAMIKAPHRFGKYAGKLLVGNFGDGKINVYSFEGDFIKTLRSSKGGDLFVDGLWGLAAGCSKVYFASGPVGESAGLVGYIAPVKCHF